MPEDKSDIALVLADDRRLAGKPWEIDGPLKKGKDLSGIACGPDRHGLIVTDEGSLVQSFRLDPDDRRLHVKEKGSPLLRAGEEADLEGMCFEGGWFYATGSHALGRATPDHQPSRHHVYRLQLDHNNLAAKADISHALEPLIENDGLLARHYRKRLNADERGLDIEGIAARTGRLLFGLRSPSLDGTAFVLSVAIDCLFGARSNRQQGLERYALELGEGAGIRDLAAVPGGVLVLSGPSTDQDRARFDLWLWGDDHSLEHLARFAGLGKIKPEGLLVLGVDHRKLNVLILFDGAERGSPRQFVLELRQ